MRLIACLVLPLLAVTSGCALFVAGPKGKSPLSPVKLAPDAVKLEVTNARFAYDETELHQQIWEQIDEMQIPVDVRRALSENGLRVGVISGELPRSIESLIARESAAPADSGDLLASPETQTTERRTTIHARAGQRSVLLTSGIYEEKPLFIHDGSQLSGATYSQAQGLFAINAAPQGDGRVRLKLQPEVQHGQSRQNFIAEEGAIRAQSARAKLTFDRLAAELDLSPGQTLVLGCRLGQPLSLGHFMFTDSTSGQTMQKLSLVRVQECKYNDMFVLDDAPAIGKRRRR
ncbi:MAG: hypothetical protein SGJ20_03970 [Planctomycetota bacterium]|nr:hypothetical protein [Planctomycetota bacterium]